MTERSICPRCRRPTVVCYCAHVESIDTRTRVMFLQHPRERDVPIGTVRIARLCLPNSELRIGVDFQSDPVVNAALADPARPAALLFPGPDARDLRTDAPAGPITLILLDGTWSQAAKLLKVNPALAALPQYRLTPERPSNYRIRREPADHCVATIEALVEVLQVLEGEGARVERMLAPFNAMVERQLEYAATVQGGRTRHRRKKRQPKPRPFPALLRDRPGDVVLAYGEANAWPFDMPDAPPPEIVHWVAQRLTTGERFEARIKPRHALAPSVEYHTRIDPEALIASPPVEDFARAWSAFVRPGDVVVTWGTYAGDVLEAQGVPLGERFDLRQATSAFLGDRTGSIEACAARMEGAVEPAWGRGRAGARMSALSSIAHALRARAPLPRAPR